MQKLTLYRKKLTHDTLKITYLRPTPYNRYSLKDKRKCDIKIGTSIYIYKVVIFVCLIITQEPLDRFAPGFDWGTRKTHGNILSLVLRF